MAVKIRSAKAESPPESPSESPSPSPPESPSESPSPSNQSFGSNSDGDDDTAHLDALAAELRGDAPGDAAPEPDVPSGAGVGADGLLTRETFAQLVGIAFSFGGDAAKLDTLKTAPGRDTFAPAVAALYDTIRDVPALHFLLKPSNVWMQRAFVVAAFAVPVASGCRAELSARRAATAPTPSAEPGAPPAQPVPADIIMPDFRNAA